MSGVDLVRRLRRDPVTSELPLIMLTARGEESDKLSGFDAGIDDYVVKPFSPNRVDRPREVPVASGRESGRREDHRRFDRSGYPRAPGDGRRRSGAPGASRISAVGTADALA